MSLSMLLRPISISFPRYAKPDRIAAVVSDRMPVTTGGAQGFEVRQPISASHHSTVAICARGPCRFGQRRVPIGFVEAILHPFSHVPVHILEPVRVGFSCPDRMRHALGVPFVPSVLVDL